MGAGPPFAPIVLVATAALFATFAATAVPSPGGNPGDTATASVKQCGKVSIGFTDARVRAKRVRCGQARQVFRTWLNKAENECDKGVCPVIEVKDFTCRHGSSELTIKVRCARPVNKVVVARWGD